MKRINPIRRILPNLLAWITGKSRTLPEEIKWAKDNWTYNLFRIWELIFWRKDGIRPETYSRATMVDGVERVTYQFFTVEAALAHFESEIRKSFKAIRIPVKIYVPVLSSPEGLMVPTGYVFAIAYDTATTNGGSGATQTYSHTVTGSNPGLLNASTQQSINTHVSGVTYNGTSMTLIDEVKYATSFYWFKGFYLNAPSTGANNIVVSYGGSGGRGSVTASYSGCDQTSAFLDAYLKKEQGNSTTISQTHTVVASNCWGVSMILGYNITYDGTLTTSGSLASKRGGISDMIMLGDSNGTISTGSVSMGWACPGGLNALLNMSIKPAASGSTTNQTVSATVAITATLAKASTFTRTLTATSVGVTGSLTKTKIIVKALTATALAVTATLVKAGTIYKTLTGTATVTGTLTKTKIILKSLTATAVAVTATLTKGSAYAKALTANVAITANQTAFKATLKALTVTIAVTGALTKAPTKILSATAAVTGTLAKTKIISKVLTATSVAISATLTKVRAVILTATPSVTSTLTKVPTKLLSVTTNITATIAKARSKTLSATAAITASLLRARGKTLTATIAVTATITRGPLQKLLAVTLNIITKVSAPFYKIKYPAHGDETAYDIKYPARGDADDYEIKYPHE